MQAESRKAETEKNPLQKRSYGFISHIAIEVYYTKKWNIRLSF